MTSANGTLASAMAAATLASQQAYAATTTGAAVTRYTFSGFQSQPWDSPLLRVAELISTGYPAWQTPPLFLPTLLPAATEHTGAPRAAPLTTASEVPVSVPANSTPPPFSAAMSGYCPPAVPELQYVASRTDWTAAATKAAVMALVTAAATSTHTEPQTPDLTHTVLRSASLPGHVHTQAPPCVQNAAATASLPAITRTVVARPIAIRPTGPMSAIGACLAAGSPLSAALSSPRLLCDSPPSIHSPGAAFSLVKPQHAAAQPLPPALQQHGLHVKVPATMDVSVPPPLKPLLRKGAPSATESPGPTAMRKRRGAGPRSPVKRRAGSPESFTEGCGDSMEVHEEGLERATGYKGRFCGRLFLKEDEKRLAAECEALGPFVGFPGPGKRGHCTVAKLARSIVAGSVRHICEQRVAEVEALRRQLQEQRTLEEAHTLQMACENAALRHELALYKSYIGNGVALSAATR